MINNKKHCKFLGFYNIHNLCLKKILLFYIFHFVVQIVRSKMWTVRRAVGSRRTRDARRAQPRLPRWMFRVRSLHAAFAERPTVRGQSRWWSTVLPHRFRKRNIPDAADRR